MEVFIVGLVLSAQILVLRWEMLRFFARESKRPEPDYLRTDVIPKRRLPPQGGSSTAPPISTEARSVFGLQHVLCPECGHKFTTEKIAKLAREGS